jgi:hypothetical protein
MTEQNDSKAEMERQKGEEEAREADERRNRHHDRKEKWPWCVVCTSSWFWLSACAFGPFFLVRFLLLDDPLLLTEGTFVPRICDFSFRSEYCSSDSELK